jgi:type III restriction enzyme
MIQLKKYQDEAIKKLSEYFFEQLGSSQRRQKLIFKAPTGSGKTITMAAFLAKIVQELPNKDLKRKAVAFIWLAPFKLHEQSYGAFKSFFGETRILTPIKFEDVQDNQLLPNDVLFVNWESVNKDSNVYVREDERDRTLQSYVYRAIGEGTEVVIVLDEAHLFATKGKRATELLGRLGAKIEIDVSATPQFSSDYQHTIRRKEVIEAQMIKRQVLLNSNIQLHEGLTAQEGLLDEALAKREQLKAAYRRLGVDINPLLLIQLPNDRAELSQTDNVVREMLTNRLGIDHNISTQNGRLAVWLSDGRDKINLSGIEQPNSMVDVLLFKQAVSLGWDCPRAAILLIYRELKQETFTVQTVGRILRMPQQKHYSEDILNIGYVYTDLARDMIQVIADDMDYIVQQYASRKAIYEDIRFLHADRIQNIRLERNRLGAKFKRIFLNTCEAHFEIKPAATEEEYAVNFGQLKKRLIRTDVKELEVHLPKDIEISGDVEVVLVATHLNIAKTVGELRPMFNRFCYQHVGNYAPADSWQVLAGAILEMGEIYFGFSMGSGEFKTMKLILFEENKPQFVALIDLALTAFAQAMEEQDRRNQSEIKSYIWEVPYTRIYNEQYEEQPSEAHILAPLFVERNRSNPEESFIAMLEANKDALQWWYKNGVKTQADFAVSYVNARGQQAAFYVDFVIKLKDGTVALFDTKTLGSDPECVAKHNALCQYVKNKQTDDKKIIGGVIVPEGKEVKVWKYCENPIENDHDTKGWTVFLPTDYL